MDCLERLVNNVPNTEFYPKMKASGTAWLKDIPYDWKVSQLGSLYVPRNERVSDKDYPPLSVTMKGIVPQLSSAAKTDDGDNRKLVRVGDFAINSRSDRRGSCGISPYDGSVSLINTVLTPRNSMHPDYYNWLFHTDAFADEFYKWGHGIVDDLWTTRWQEMKRIKVPVPSYEEQQNIANYLNFECKRIEEIIAAAKHNIDDYKLWKAAVLYDAVTKGASQNQSLKDCGVKWIGSIPSHWQVSKIGRFIKIRSGITLGKTYPQGTELIEMPYLRVANVKAEGFSLEDVAKIKVTPEEVEKYALKSGELLMTEGGDRDKLGRGTIWHEEISPCLHQNHVFAVTCDENWLLTEYLAYLTASPVGREYFDLTAKKTTNLASTNSNTIMQFKVPIPPIAEQREIVQMLDRKCAAINDLITEKQLLISDLELYKKSLIYEVVTGKRKVV